MFFSLDEFESLKNILFLFFFAMVSCIVIEGSRECGESSCRVIEGSRECGANGCKVIEGSQCVVDSSLLG